MEGVFAIIDSKPLGMGRVHLNPVLDLTLTGTIDDAAKPPFSRLRRIKIGCHANDLSCYAGGEVRAQRWEVFVKTPHGADHDGQVARRVRIENDLAEILSVHKLHLWWGAFRMKHTIEVKKQDAIKTQSTRWKVGIPHHEVGVI